MKRIQREKKKQNNNNNKIKEEGYFCFVMFYLIFLNRMYVRVTGGSLNIYIYIYKYKYVCFCR